MVLGSGAAVVRANIQVSAAVRQTAGAVNIIPCEGVDADCISLPVCGSVPAMEPMPMSRISASLPP
jgi:hypothetical protein